APLPPRVSRRGRSHCDPRTGRLTAHAAITDSLRPRRSQAKVLPTCLEGPPAPPLYCSRRRKGSGDLPGLQSRRFGPSRVEWWVRLPHASAISVWFDGTWKENEAAKGGNKGN